MPASSKKAPATARTALITGGSRGIGRGIALALAAEGFDVAISYRADHDTATRTAAEIERLGRHVVTVAGDLSDPDEAGRVVAEAAEGLGGLDVLVANAGRLTTGPLLETTPADYDLQLDANARGTFFTLQAAARRMIDAGTRGRIVVITSDAATRAYRGLAAYCMSKAAARMLTEAAAIELAPHGITVNAVAPGTTETDLNREALADPAQRETLLGSILLDRPGQPEDVAAAVAFLASDGAGFMTGATVAVDGGAAIH